VNEVINMALGVHPEVGRLRRVLVHRPGLEHTRLTPSNAEELLFDDVIWVARAKAEHDMFGEVMRDRGVEVFEIETLLAEALAKPEAKDWVCDHILSERQVGITASEQARAWVGSAGPTVVAEFLIGGITKADAPRRRRCCGSPGRCSGPGPPNRSSRCTCPSRAVTCTWTR
jgi:arginine deiminase